MQLGMKRDAAQSLVQLTEHVSLSGGKYFFGTQMGIGTKLLPGKGAMKDGAGPRKLVSVKPFSIDVDCVTNEQFAAFIAMTGYQTEAELYTWSFVLDSQVSDDVKAEVDGERGFGRVKNSEHWMAVHGASWQHPFGMDSTVGDIPTLPVVHVSYRDATEYCAWAGLRLPNEKEWEYAARGGRQNQSYPWGNTFKPENMNIWGGEGFPKTNDLSSDGYHGPAPVRTFPPNDYGLFNTVGNVWEWARGGKAEARILRGGSFVDSVHGKFNHAVRVSTRQLNSGDSAATNIGFRCAGNVKVDGGVSDGGNDSAQAKASGKKASSAAAVTVEETIEHIDL